MSGEADIPGQSRRRTGPAGARRISPVFAAIAIALCPLLAPSGGLSYARAANAANTKAANRRRARQDAKHLLRRLVLPPHATRLGSGSPGAPALRHPGLLPGTPDLVDLHSSWRVPERPAAVRAFLEAHPPQGTTRSGSGHLPGVPSGMYLQFSSPPIGEELGIRWLVVRTQRLTAGQTEIRADAEVQWIVPRPASERIPASVREIGIRAPRRHSASPRFIRVSRPGRVRSIVRIVDRLPLVQPGLVECPAFRPTPAARKITLSFRAKAGAPALAVARFPEEAEGTCDGAMSLQIRGEAQAPLNGGYLALRRIGELLRVRL